MNTVERERIETVCYELPSYFLYQLEGSRTPEHELLIVMEVLAEELASGGYIPEKEWLSHLLKGLIYMRAGVDETFTLNVDFNVRWQGLEALYAQALFWGTPPDERANWPRGYVEAMTADAAALRGALRAYAARYGLREEHYG